MSSMLATTSCKPTEDQCMLYDGVIRMYKDRLNFYRISENSSLFNLHYLRYRLSRENDRLALDQATIGMLTESDTLAL